MNADLLILHAGELCTLAGPARPRRGAEMRELGIVRDGAVAIAAGRVVAVGRTRHLRRAWSARRVVDADGRLVTPGLVDAHTHLVFAGSRAREFEMRALGRSYLEIAKAGGGILSTVRAVRKASRRELLRLAQERRREMFAWGTTFCEVKSGYGLEERRERLQLLVAVQTLCTVATFLGAHAVPPGTTRSEYVRRVIDMIPRMRHALFVDVFCDRGAFTVAEARRILEAARAHGYGLKIHAEEFAPTGGAELAADLGATSADHLNHVTRRGIAALARSDTVAVLLPTTSVLVGLPPAPARRLIEAGVPVALGTDYNPGTSMTPALPLAMTLACTQLHMSAAEALTAATVNAAYACGLGRGQGWYGPRTLEPGHCADVVIWNVDSHGELPYRFGGSRPWRVYAEGREVSSDA